MACSLARAPARKQHAPLPDSPIERRTLWRDREQASNEHSRKTRSFAMKRFWMNLWMDDCGALLATEWVVLATLLVLGVVPGLIAIRNGLLHEMKDLANATMSLDQSYEFTGNELMFDD